MKLMRKVIPIELYKQYKEAKSFPFLSIDWKNWKNYIAIWIGRYGFALSWSKK